MENRLRMVTIFNKTSQNIKYISRRIIPFALGVIGGGAIAGAVAGSTGDWQLSAGSGGAAAMGLAIMADRFLNQKPYTPL